MSEVGRGKRCTKKNSAGQYTCTRMQQTGGFCKQHYDLAMRGRPRGLVDPGPAMAHIHALGAAGISQNRVGELLGIPQVTIWEIASGKRKKLLASTADKILSLPITHAPCNIVHPRATIPVLGSQRRLRALMAAGFTAKMIAPEIGVNKRAVIRFTAAEQPFIWASTASAIADLFERWRLLTGPSVVTRKRSAEKGWPKASEWNVDEIDDPNAVPVHQQRMSFPERIAEYRELGRTDEEIAEAMGIKLSTLQTNLSRHGLPTGKRYRDFEDFKVKYADGPMSKRKAS